MYLLQSFHVNMSVNLSGGNIHVTQHLLDASQIRTTGQKVCCEAVPQRVDRKIFRHTRTGGIFFDKSPDFNPAERPTRPAQQKRFAAERPGKLWPK